MRLLLFGGTGQVGTELRDLAVTHGTHLVAPPRSVIDLEDQSSIAEIVAAEPWDIIVNAAGYTNVDHAESEEALALAVNGKAAGYLAAEAARRGLPLIHLSTDYVFDGRKGCPYLEDDITAPINAYGRSKLAGELAVRAVNPRHVVLRTAWVYSPYGKNFVRTILRLAEERDRLTVVADQSGCPTAARDVAQACLDIGFRCAANADEAPYGVYHFAGAGEASWFELATAVVVLAAGRLPRSPQVAPIRTVDYPTLASRPADTRLDCTAVVREFGVTLRPWRSALAETVDRLVSSEAKP
jgi:dTDP-4-dehydrorhamnose reductase